jgi:microcystin-dependent protein
MFAGNFAPAGWALCNGAMVSISDYPTLYQLIGTTYGGDGMSTFALPDLQSRLPVHVGAGFVLGQTGGAETVTLTVSQIPSHSHVPQGSTAQGNAASPQGGVWAESVLNNYVSSAPSVTMDAAAVSPAGGSQPHDNMCPFVAINFIISFFGVFPSQS